MGAFSLVASRRIFLTTCSPTLKWDDSLGSRDWLIPGLVMPGEEEDPQYAAKREQVFGLWRAARAAIVVGFAFGLYSRLDYDRVWLDTFVEAFRHNSHAPIHIVAPDAERVRGELVERLKRTVNVHGWPLNWHVFARVVLTAARQRNVARIQELRVHEDTLDRVYAAAADAAPGKV